MYCMGWTLHLWWQTSPLSAFTVFLAIPVPMGWWRLDFTIAILPLCTQHLSFILPCLSILHWVRLKHWVLFSTLVFHVMSRDCDSSHSWHQHNPSQFGSFVEPYSAGNTSVLKHGLCLIALIQSSTTKKGCRFNVKNLLQLIFLGHR